MGERAEGEMDLDKEEFEQVGEGTVRRNEGSLESDGKSSTEGDLGELVVYTLLERRGIPFSSFQRSSARRRELRELLISLEGTEKYPH